MLPCCPVTDKTPLLYCTGKICILSMQIQNKKTSASKNLEAKSRANLQSL